MSEWIKTSEKLPENDQECWIVTRYNSEFDYVEKAEFQSFRKVYIDDEKSYIKAFVIETSSGDWIINLNEVSHWKPFIKPELPKD